MSGEKRGKSEYSVIPADPEARALLAQRATEAVRKRDECPITEDIVDNSEGWHCPDCERKYGPRTSEAVLRGPCSCPLHGPGSPPPHEPGCPWEGVPECDCFYKLNRHSPGCATQRLEAGPEALRTDTPMVGGCQAVVDPTMPARGAEEAGTYVYAPLPRCTATMVRGEDTGKPDAPRFRCLRPADHADRYGHVFDDLVAERIASEAMFEKMQRTGQAGVKPEGTAVELSPEEERTHKLWSLTARVLGFNELAKQGATLGEKVYSRVARDIAQEELVSLGGQQILRQGDEPIILELPLGGPPFIRFRPSDIELMRDAVRAHDAEARPTEAGIEPTKIDEACAMVLVEAFKSASTEWPSCGCSDGTGPDEPADRGFICPHDPRGMSEVELLLRDYRADLLSGIGDKLDLPEKLQRASRVARIGKVLDVERSRTDYPRTREARLEEALRKIAESEAGSEQAYDWAEFYDSIRRFARSAIEREGT